jgi:hypothetical protein
LIEAACEVGSKRLGVLELFAALATTAESGTRATVLPKNRVATSESIAIRKGLRNALVRAPTSLDF